MSPGENLRARLGHTGAWALGLGALAAAGWAVATGVDRLALTAIWHGALATPLTLAGALGAYAAAFLLRAWAWRRVTNGLSLGHALAGIHLALAGNHLLPLRLGEPLRVASVTRRTRVPARVAGASTVALRGADLAALGMLAVGLSWAVAAEAPTPAVWAVAAGGSLVAAGGVAWVRRERSHGRGLRLPGPEVVAAAAAAWLAEAGIVWAVAGWAGVALSAPEAALVSVLAVAGQIAAIAPAGLGTYEAAGTAGLVALGVDPATGLAVVLAAHAVKTGYALLAGAVAAVAPAPGLLGRLRLPRTRPPRPDAGRSPSADAPVVLFLPAHNEQATVAAVVARAPAAVRGRPVRCLVVDDGSADATAAAARAAGAQVVRSPTNQGLGAAVRHGLAAATALAPAAVAFCDADGEYAPEELERLVAPIIDGEADYVVGSRFAGAIARMLPHRRLGNRVLTAWLAFTAREAVSDGQSGYRALSPAAAAAAEIAHDYNYAQVLTLDLLARGFRYAEVPIGYHFREHGRSFVRLGRYLAAVVPSVYRVVSGAGAHAAETGDLMAGAQP